VIANASTARNQHRPGLPPEGETGKGESKFLAAAGHCFRATAGICLLASAPASPYSHSKAGIPLNERQFGSDLKPSE